MTMGDVLYIRSSYDWSNARVHYPVEVVAPPSGTPSKLPKVQARSGATAREEKNEARKQAVKRAFVKSWEAYKKHAWLWDELMPLSGTGRQSLSGWSAQLVDALDTLWIMGLRDDFRTAVRQVARIDWARSNNRMVNLFEVTIRYLGGLLSAYDLSQEPVLLAKAIELGDALYAGFDTPNRLPPRWLLYSRARSGEQRAEVRMSGAAGGSASLEFTRLSQITGDAKYYDATERVKRFFFRTQNTTKIPGLWPLMLNYHDETADETVFTLGAGADSLYEYLPKMYALLGGLDRQYAVMTTKALDAARDELLFRPATSDPKKRLLLAGNSAWAEGKTYRAIEMQHLTCFAGGMYGLAGKLLEREDYVEAGLRLTAGCVWAYESFAANIMPEISDLMECGKPEGPCDKGELAQQSKDLPEGFVRVRDKRYMLRPEAIESVFYMWRITGDAGWRETAWRMWEAIVRETETKLAFSSIEDVTVQGSRKIDSMEVRASPVQLHPLHIILACSSSFHDSITRIIISRGDVIGDK